MEFSWICANADCSFFLYIYTKIEKNVELRQDEWLKAKMNVAFKLPGNWLIIEKLPFISIRLSYAITRALITG